MTYSESLQKSMNSNCVLDFIHPIIYANELGANAIINIHYDANEVMAGVTEVLCYGTAVQVVNT